MYSNAYRIHTSAEEVVIDLGFNMPNPNPNPQQGGGQAQLLFKVTDRVIMSYSNAKRLAASMTQLIRRYEQGRGRLPADLRVFHSPSLPLGFVRIPGPAG